MCYSLVNQWCRSICDTMERLINFTHIFKNIDRVILRVNRRNNSFDIMTAMYCVAEITIEVSM